MKSPVATVALCVATVATSEASGTRNYLQAANSRPTEPWSFRGGGATEDVAKMNGRKKKGSKRMNSQQKSRSNERGKVKPAPNNVQGHASEDHFAKEDRDSKPVEKCNEAHSKNSSSEPSSNPEEKPLEISSPSIVEEVLSASDNFYAILGLESPSQGMHIDTSQIQKAYRRRAVQTHPDKTGGDRRAFDKVAEAYDALSDLTNRKVYDRWGKRGLDAHRQSEGMTTEDMFRGFFQGRGFPQQQPKRNPTVRYRLDLTLEELYHGTERVLEVSDPSNAEMNPFSVHREAPATKKLTLNIDRGTEQGQRIVISGAMDFDSDEAPGDLVFLVNQIPHQTFTRKGYDLAIYVSICWKEALCGVKRSIRHLNGNVIRFRSTSNSDKVIVSGDVQVLKGMGMPKNSQGTEYGDLYIQYKVASIEPSKTGITSLSLEEKQELGRLLDKLTGTTEEEVATTVDESWAELSHASVEDFGVTSGMRQHGNDDYEDSNEDVNSSQNMFFSSVFGYDMEHRRRRRSNDQQSSENVQCRQM